MTYVSRMALTPAPEEVASRVVAAVRAVWPESDEGEAALLDQLMVCDVGAADEREPGYEMASFRTRDWEDTTGTIQTWRGRLLSLGWHLYAEPDNEPGNGDSTAAEGYIALRELLTEALGDPVEEWGSAEEPAVYWSHEGKSVEMHCFRPRATVVQIDVGHQARSAELEAKPRLTRPS